jgi:hypothetical protein
MDREKSIHVVGMKGSRGVEWKGTGVEWSSTKKMLGALDHPWVAGHRDRTDELNENTAPSQ